MDPSVRSKTVSALETQMAALQRKAKLMEDDIRDRARAVEKHRGSVDG